MTGHGQFCKHAKFQESLTDELAAGTGPIYLAFQTVFVVSWIPKVLWQ
jgi:hypothetical protein